MDGGTGVGKIFVEICHQFKKTLLHIVMDIKV
jgi:hypothetical protein